MKKTILFLSIVSFCLMGYAQPKELSREEARFICAELMGNFTAAVAEAYQEGISYEEFESKLCGKWQPTEEGRDQLEAAYRFLSKGATKDEILKTYPGKEIANSLKYLYEKKTDSDGSELFGNPQGEDRKDAAACKWWQFWCHVKEFFDWVIQNWSTIAQIIAVVLAF